MPELVTQLDGGSAIALADTDGLPAVTMQAVAKSLEFTTMSLYRYVAGKDELLYLMQDAAVAFPEKVKLPDQWRAAVRTWAKLIRDGYREHPWVLGIPRGQISVLMPNSVRIADLGLAALSALNLSDDEKISVILLVTQHVASTVALEQDLAAEGTVSLSTDGAEVLSEVITADRFPHLHPLVAAGGYVGGEAATDDTDLDAQLDFDLDLIIAGLESIEHDRSHA